MRSRTNQFYFAIAVLVCLCVFSSPAQGLSTVADYANRLAQAERAVSQTLEGDISVGRLEPMTGEVKRLLPVSEEVEFNGAIIRVDNAWLHETLNKALKMAEDESERRLLALNEISARLARLRQSVMGAQTRMDQASQDQRARLNDILARAEYQPEAKRESMIAYWINKALEKIAKALAKLLGAASPRAPQTGGGLIMVLRALIFLIVIAALIFGGMKLARRLKIRRKPVKEKGTREALGEEIAEDATTADLFAMASELARKGEYRKAIRRAYIALLCDLDQRGKLRLGRSKTNRDYLDAMRSEHLIYPTFSVMTFAFERAWYGQNHATQEDFQNFVTLYQEAIK